MIEYRIDRRRKSNSNQEVFRLFTVQALNSCEVLRMTVQDIDKLKLEFPDVFDELFANSLKILKKALKLKDETIKSCEVTVKFEKRL